MKYRMEFLSGPNAHKAAQEEYTNRTEFKRNDSVDYHIHICFCVWFFLKKQQRINELEGSLSPFEFLVFLCQSKEKSSTSNGYMRV